MNLGQTLRLVLVRIAIMLLVLLGDAVRLVPAESRALATAPATNTPRAVSLVNHSIACCTLDSKTVESAADFSFLDKYTRYTHNERDRAIMTRVFSIPYVESPSYVARSEGRLYREGRGRRARLIQ